MGAPGDLPPCILQRLFGIAGDWHGFPLRVRAPQRGLWCMANLLCMGLILLLSVAPTPTPVFDRADHGLPSGVDVDMLHCNLLLTLATMLVEGIEQGCPCAREFVCLVQALAPSLECLVPEHGAAIALHRGIVSG